MWLLFAFGFAISQTTDTVPFNNFAAVNNTLAAFGCFASPLCRLATMLDSCPDVDANATDPIRCDGNGNLVYLQAAASGLNGTVSSYIGYLSHLTVLLLGNNNLQGTLPSELALLTSIQVLDLSANIIEGTVPFINSPTLRASYCFLQLDMWPGNCLDLTSQNCANGDCICDASGGICTGPTGMPVAVPASHTGAIVAGVVIVLVFLLCMSILFLYYMKKAGKILMRLPWYDRHTHKFRMR